MSNKGNVRRSNLGFFEPIKLVVKVPEDDDSITLDESVSYPMKIWKLIYATGSGSIDFTLTINGAATSVANETATTDQTVEVLGSPVVLAEGDKLALVFSNNADAEMFSIKIEGIYG